MKLSKIVNEIYELCLLDNWNGYYYVPTSYHGYLFDTFFLNKYKKNIEKIKQIIDKLNNYKDSKAYKEDLDDDTIEKINILYYASKDIEETNLKDVEDISIYNKLLNKYLKLFGLRMRFNEENNEIIEIYNKNNEMILSKKILVIKEDNDNSSLFPSEDKYYCIDSKGEDKHFTMIYIPTKNKNNLEINITLENKNEIITLNTIDRELIDIKLVDKNEINSYTPKYFIGLSNSFEISSSYELFDKSQVIENDTPPVMRRLILKGIDGYQRNFFVKEELLAEDDNGNIVIPKDEDSYNGHVLRLSSEGIVVDYKNYEYKEGLNFNNVCSYYLNYPRCQEVFYKCLSKIYNRLDGLENIICDDYSFFVNTFNKNYKSDKYLDTLEHYSEFKKVDNIIDKKTIK